MVPWDHRNTVGQLTQLKGCRRGHGLFRRNGLRRREMGGHLHERTAGVQDEQTEVFLGEHKHKPWLGCWWQRDSWSPTQDHTNSVPWGKKTELSLKCSWENTPFTNCMFEIAKSSAKYCLCVCFCTCLYAKSLLVKSSFLYTVSLFLLYDRLMTLKKF